VRNERTTSPSTPAAAATAYVIHASGHRSKEVDVTAADAVPTSVDGVGPVVVSAGCKDGSRPRLRGRSESRVHREQRLRTGELTSIVVVAEPDTSRSAPSVDGSHRLAINSMQERTS